MVIIEIIYQDYFCYQMFGIFGEYIVNENKGFFIFQVQLYIGIFILYYKIMFVIKIFYSLIVFRKFYLMWKIFSKLINDILVLIVNLY